MKLKHSYLFRTLLTFLLFACVSVNAHAESVTYAQSSKSETVALSNPDGAKVKFSTTYNTNTFQLTEGHSMIYTFSGFDDYIITGVTLKMRSNKSAGSGYIEIKVGNDLKYKEIGQSINGVDITNKRISTFKDWYGSYHYDAANYASIMPAISPTIVGKGENLVITIGATVNSLYCQSVTIDYEMPNGYVKSPTLPTSCSFMEPMNVKITNNTDGATIYYTTDKSEPSANKGTIYSEPFTITETTTVKAIAVKGNAVSGIAEATYTKIVPECVLPAVSPQGGNTPESALSITQNSNITITPTKYNTITYSINEGIETTTTEAVSISADEIGDMKLTVISACGDNRLEATYYYNVEEVKQVSAMLTSNEIRNKKDTGSGYYKGNLVESTCGSWKGYYSSDQKNGRILLKSDKDEGFYLQSPEFPGNIVSVTITLTLSNTEGRGFVIMSAGYTGNTGDKASDDYIGEASYEGEGAYAATVEFNKTSTAFKIYATSETIYFSQIEVVYEKPADHTLKVGSTGWSTLYLGLDATIPEGVTCYTISSVTDKAATLTPITTGTLPANTGVIINAEANTQYSFHYKNSYGGSEGISNSLKGTLSNEYVSGGGYVLSIQNGEIGFYKAQEKENGTFLNNANKAYLPASAVPASLQSNGLRFKIDDTVNIEYQDTILNYDCQSTIIYDLMGHRVEHMQKGIYIVNGRKVIVP